MAKRKLTERGEIEAVLLEAQEGVLGTVDAGGAPYLTPLNFVYIPEAEYAQRFAQDDAAGGAAEPGVIGRIFFHCALRGHKLENLARDPRVCFCAYTDVRMVLAGERACDCAVRYQSALCFGTARVVPDGPAKIELLTALSAKYMPQPIAPPTAQRAGGAALVEIRVTELTGKANVDSRQG